MMPGVRTMARTDLFAVVTIKSELDVTADLHPEATVE